MLGVYLYNTKAITTQGQVIGAIAYSSIAKIECLLPLEGMSRIGIRYSLREKVSQTPRPCHRGAYHLADAEAIQYTSSVIAYVMDRCTFSDVETNPETPFLPFDEASI